MKVLNKIAPLLLVSIFVYGTSSAQDKLEYFEVPLKYVNFMLLNDEKSPLQLSDRVVLATRKGHLHYFYKITNLSDSSVKSFRIEGFDAFVNPSYTASPTGKADDELAFLPYESLSTLSDERKARMRISPLDEQHAREFKLSDENKRIWIVLVTKVEMYDGTTYDATAKFSAIKKFVDQIQDSEDALEDDAPRTPFREKEMRLHEFIANIMKNGNPR